MPCPAHACPRKVVRNFSASALMMARSFTSGAAQLRRDVARVEVRQRHQLVGVGCARRRRPPAHRLRMRVREPVVDSTVRPSRCASGAHRAQISSAAS